jgi:acyl carrier protein
MDHKAAIRKFLQDLLAAKGDRRPFSDDDSLVFSGRLQSVDAVDVAVFLEENYGVDFAEMGFDQERLDTLNGIVGLIEETRRVKH